MTAGGANPVTHRRNRVASRRGAGRERGRPGWRPFRLPLDEAERALAALSGEAGGPGMHVAIVPGA